MSRGASIRPGSTCSGSHLHLLSGIPFSEDHITTDAARTVWQYGEAFVPEDEVLLRARDRAAGLGRATVSPGAGALLSVLAATLAARAAVVVCGGAGSAALWLLRGMPADGVLTTIDPSPEDVRAARRAFADDGVAAGRTRTIAGRADEVLPRLADGAYDLVLICGEPHAWHDYVVEALRLLRVGGLLAVDGALHGGLVVDPAADDEGTAAARDLGAAVRADAGLVPAFVPVGDGLLLAVKTA